MKNQTPKPAELSEKLFKILDELIDARNSLQCFDLGKKEEEKKVELERLINQAPQILNMRRCGGGYINFTPLATAAHWGLVSTFGLLLKKGARLYDDDIFLISHNKTPDLTDLSGLHDKIPLLIHVKNQQGDQVWVLGLDALKKPLLTCLETKDADKLEKLEPTSTPQKLKLEKIPVEIYNELESKKLHDHQTNIPSESHGRNIISNAAYNNQKHVIAALAKNYPDDFEKLVNTFDSSVLLPLDYTLPNSAKEVAVFLMETSCNLTLPHPQQGKLLEERLDERKHTLDLGGGVTEKMKQDRTALIKIIRDTSKQFSTWKTDAVSRFVENTKDIMPYLQSLQDRYAPPPMPDKEKTTQNPEKYVVVSDYIKEMQSLLGDISIDTLSKKNVTKILAERYQKIALSLNALKTDETLIKPSSTLSSIYGFFSSHKIFFVEQRQSIINIINKLNEEKERLENPEDEKNPEVLKLQSSFDNVILDYFT